MSPFEIGVVDGMIKTAISKNVQRQLTGIVEKGGGSGRRARRLLDFAEKRLAATKKGKAGASSTLTQNFGRAYRSSSRKAMDRMKPGAALWRGTRNLPK